MKLLLKIPLLILLTCAIFFVACNKEEVIHSSINLNPDTPILIQDTLTGKEVIFNNVIFERGADLCGCWVNEVYTVISTRPDLFYQARSLDVSIKFDTSSVWINALKFDSHIAASPVANYNEYYYFVDNSIKELFVFPYPFIDNLPGTKISIKVKFL